MTRRDFIVTSAAGALGGCGIIHDAADYDFPAIVRFGMITDLHYADRPDQTVPQGVAGTRYYRQSLGKLEDAVSLFNILKLDFVIELGDFKDLSPTREATVEHLDRIEEAFAKFEGPRFHVAGNHDFDCLTPEEFYAHTPNDGDISENGFYTFCRGGTTFIVLNGCFDSQMRPYSRSNPWEDSNIPPWELEKLEKAISDALGPVIVFCHQRLDEAAAPHHAVRNAAEVRAVLERSGRVRAVFTGHEHLGGTLKKNGILYYTLHAAACGDGKSQNSYAVASVTPGGLVDVTGFLNANAKRGAR